MAETETTETEETTSTTKADLLAKLKGAAKADVSMPEDDAPETTGTPFTEEELKAEATAIEELNEELAERLEGDNPGEIAEGEAFGGKKETPVSPTALNLDAWSLRKGSEVLEHSEMVRKVLGVEGKAGNPLLAKDEGEAKFIHQMEHWTADFHAAAFEPQPELAQKCADPAMRKYMEQLLATPQWKALHAETMLDVDASEIAATSFADGWLKCKEKVAEACEKEGTGGDGGLGGSSMEAMRGVAGALRKAEADVNEWRDIQRAMGMGGDGGNAAGKMPKAEIAKRFRGIKNSRVLRRICELAGKFRRLAQAQQRRRMQHGMDDMVGIEQGGNIERLIPSEIMQLADPVYETYAMKRLIENASMIRKHMAIDSTGRGPIVVVVDESGSMNGEPICIAKAIALAMYWIAQHQKRYCLMVGYSGACDGNFLVIKPEEPRPIELMEWLEHFYSGGTEMDVPLEVLPKRWEELEVPKGKTDVLSITDAYCHVPEEVGKRFNEWKEENEVRFQAIIINDDPGELETVCDSVYRVNELDVETEALKEIFQV